MNTKTVAIYGAGIAGLTVAHELIKLGYKVDVYESLGAVGGFARSERTRTHMPTEHSWRGYAPFYANFFNLVREIPFGNRGKGTVYNQLTKPIRFVLPGDGDGDGGSYTVSDKLILGYYALKVLCAGKRSVEYAAVNFYDLVYHRLSAYARDNVIAMLGPGLGLDQHKASLYHVIKFIELNMVNHTHLHEHAGEVYKHKSFDSWHVMSRPTSEAWFDPWVEQLKKLGVVVHLNSKLVNVVVGGDGMIEKCIVDGDSVEADYHVLAMDPFSVRDLVSSSGIGGGGGELNKFDELVADGPNIMIGFRIAFSESIGFERDNDVFAFPDSEFNITMYPQDRLFTDDVELGNGVKGLWSGTVCSADVVGTLFGLSAARLTIAQLREEIVYQISRSAEFNNIIKQHNGGRSFSDFDIVGDVEIWREFKYVGVDGNGANGELVSKHRKWSNTTTTFKHRPGVVTRWGNLFVTGAHCKTSVDIWSMEGAVESGKMCSRAILGSDEDGDGDKVFLYEHKKNVFFSVVSAVDDVLFVLGLPSVVVVVLLLMVLMVLVMLRRSVPVDHS